MALSAFDDPGSSPTGEALRGVLGEAANGRWAAVIAAVEELAPGIEARWAFGGPRFGWSLRLVLGERVILHLTPQDGRFVAGTALGEKAIARATEAGVVGERTLAIVGAAPRYAEGRGVRITIETADDVAVVRELARVKLA